MRETILTASIGPTRFSFGYHWQLAVSDQTLKDDAEREAALEGVQADVIALRAGSGHAQFGLGWLKPDDRRKGTVAAIAFATIQARHTARKAIGLFDIGPAWWFCAIDDDLIHDEADRVFLDVRDAMSAFGAAMVKKHWDRIYFPDDLLQNALARRRSAGTDPRNPSEQIDEILHRRTVTSTSIPVITTPLHQLLADTQGVFHYQHRLRRLDIQAGLTSSTSLAAFAVIIIMLAIAGWKPIYQKFFRPKPLPVIAKAAPAPPPPPPMPIAIVNTPVPPLASPEAYVAQCLDLLTQLEDNLPAGWSNQGLECSDRDATMRIGRHDGAIAHLERAWIGARYSYNDDYSLGTVSLPIEVAAAPIMAPLAEAESVRRRLYSIGWATDEKITVSSFAPPPGRLPIDRANWRLATLQIDTETDPREWAKALDHIPGLTVTALAVHSGDAETSLHWLIKGSIYAAN